jgi:FSR family fosmidomycin resistance protein-like MFS transporter
MVHTYAGKRLGFSLSIFNMGGTLGFGVGPLFITWLVATYGLHMTPVTIIPGLVLMAVLFMIVPLPEGAPLKNRTFIGSLREAFGGVWKTIAVIWLIMVLRAFSAHAFRTFLPIFYAKEGFPLTSIGLLVSLFTIAGTISGLLAGYLSYKVGYKKIFYVSYILSTPALLSLLFASGWWAYPVIFMAGFVIMATLPLGVALAQELAPKGRSMVSSIMMGFAFGLGGMLSPLVGGLADIFSIESVLALVACIPLITTGLVYFLPEGQVDRSS